MKSIIFYFFAFWTIAPSSCKSDKTPIEKPIEVITIPTFLDSMAASIAIVEADADGFYDQLSVADASIQMKKSDGFNSQEEAKDAYIVFIKSQVEDFNEEEKAYMTKVFEEVNRKLQKVNKDLILPNLQLVKLKLDHYGEDVYYTRGNMICLPKNTLKRDDLKGQTNIMLHEIWHILSRKNKPLRDKVYNLIGFTEHKRDIKLSTKMKDILLTNPDGVSQAYAIDLGDGIEALPIITSQKSKYEEGKPRFFDYLNFDLYEIDDEGNVLTKPNGETTIPPKNNAIFFKKIKDNTQYIIHPDEITADNFMLGVNAVDDGDLKQYSPEGKKLLTDIIKIIQNFKR